MTTSAPVASATPMVTAASGCLPMAITYEKENDHLPPFRKSWKKQGSGDTAGFDNVGIRRPLLGIAYAGQGTAALKPTAPLHELLKTPSPDFVKPAGTCTPLVSPRLKKLGSPSPGSSLPSPVPSMRYRISTDLARTARSMRQVASASPERSDTPPVGDIQDRAKSAQGLPLPPHTRTRAIVRVRTRRALTLHSGDKDRDVSERPLLIRRNGCSKSVGELNLSGARLQSAARANLSRSANWPASSAACIRKRTVEGSGYEVPRKSVRHEESPRWCSAAACLARLSLQDKGDHAGLAETPL